MGIFALALPDWETGRPIPQRPPRLVLLFADGNVSLAGGGTIFTAGVVLAVMILATSPVTREVFSLTPRGHVEAAGTGQWKMGSQPMTVPRTQR
ncbi:MAG: hypothetical protein H6521_14135 [Mycolicibacterium sp.]|nr:hypothetical protein [Mycolicibacterium sp.]